jgi:predicted Zn-dependent protease
MILAEKLAQKLNNLKSKNEIKDFFIFFDESKGLSLTADTDKISPFESPTTYRELTTGYYLIVWDKSHYSSGEISTSAVDDFEEFINLSQQIKVKYKDEIFIPERGIYPFAISYAKTLADMIDIPEYLLKISDITLELFKMVSAPKAKNTISVQDGVRYAYSSRSLDENYSYTIFKLELNLDDKINWQIELSDSFPLARFHEIFSFLGDIYVILQTTKEIKIETKKTHDVIITPSVFEKLFNDQILKNIEGTQLMNSQSIFTLTDFQNKTKVLGSFSLSYDPLINNKLGTYRFTSFGLKPKRQYFIKFGKLDTPITNNMNFATLGYKEPTVEVSNFQNLKFEGIKRKFFNDLRSEDATFLMGTDNTNYFPATPDSAKIIFETAIIMKDGIMQKSEGFSVNINLIDIIRTNHLEIIEFPDGQVGGRIKNVEEIKNLD